MPDPIFDQLAADAAAGLKGDPELFLDVKQELCAHLEDKADALHEQGLSEEESTELARQAFGSPLDVAAELLEANRRKMKLRGLLRLAFGMLIVPLAVALALYVGYGRFAREQAMIAWINEGTYRLPTLPLLGMAVAPTTNGASVVQQLNGAPGNAENIRRYWEAHRRQPNHYIYYAFYALTLAPKAENTYVATMRLGEQLEPNNALYHLLLAEYYLERGIWVYAYRMNRKRKPPELIMDQETFERMKAEHRDLVLDRRAFNLGMAELRIAARKPYLHEYEMEIVRTQLDSLPRPLLTEDYLEQNSVAASIQFSQLTRQRTLTRSIPACARLLAKEGRTADAIAVMDTWKPLSLLFARDGDTVLIKGLAAYAYATQLAKDGHDVYAALGAQTAAGEAQTLFARLKQCKDGWQQGNPGAKFARERLMRQHGSLLSSLLYPVFSGIQPDDLRPEELTPGRMHDHVLFEEFTVELVLIILTLALVGTLIQGVIWLHRLRRADSIPLLLLPPAKTILRSLVLGIVLPMLVYWCYSRLPLIGGREYGWLSGMWPRFAAELLGVAVLLLWLPHRMIRHGIRKRCAELGIALPEKKDESSTTRIVFIGIIVACIVAAVAIFIPGNVSPLLRLAGILLAAGISQVGMRYASGRRQRFGMYYGTLARSLSPVYAFSIILLSLIAQPWLLYQEAHWLQNDMLTFGYLAKKESGLGMTLIEVRTSQHFSKLLQQTLRSDTQTPAP